MATVNRAAKIDRDVISALQLWQTFEYLASQDIPEEKQAENDCVWHLNPQASDDAQMPWRDSAKIDDLAVFFKQAKNHRFQLFAGVIPGNELIETTRRLLDAPGIDLSEQKEPSDVASFVIPLDRHGYVTGDIFVSSVPWAVKCIEEAQEAQKQDSRRLFSFSGFFGLKGVEQRVKDKVRALMIKRQLVEIEIDRATQDAGTGQGAARSSGAVLSAASPSQRSRELRTLQAQDVREVAEVVFRECGWRPTGEGRWAIKAEQAPEAGQGRPPEDPLNSFFAEDLESVQATYRAGQVGETLVKFLEMQRHPQRIDLEEDRQPLIEGVHPDVTPTACWPSEHPLVTAQQFAVNAIMRDLAQGGLFAVNGPPGTGKTTMLKDIVATIVCQRAEAMIRFDSPLDAFTGRLVIEDDPSDPRFGVPQLLHDSLRGFGMVVACSGNVAAENISMELPGKKTIDCKIPVDYFSEVANSMGLPPKAKQRSDKRWGLVSVPLGNSSNRSAFTTSFWYGPKKSDKEKAAQKSRRDGGKQGDVPDGGPPDPLRLMTLQNWVKEFRSTVPDWQTARETFRAALARSNAARMQAARLVQSLQQHEHLRDQPAKWVARRSEIANNVQHLLVRLKQAQDTRDSANAALIIAGRTEKALQAVRAQHEALAQHEKALGLLDQCRPKATAAELHDSIRDTERARDRLHQELQTLHQVRPSWLRSLLRPHAARQWEERHAALMDESKQLRDSLATLDRQAALARKWENDRAAVAENVEMSTQALAQIEAEASRLGIDRTDSLEQAQRRRQTCEETLHSASAVLTALRDKIGQEEAALQEGDKRNAIVEQRLHACRTALAGTGLLDAKSKWWHLREFSREEFHKASPYQDSPDLFDARRQLFVAALELHKAFIIHAWTKLRPTLNAMVAMLSGQVRPHLVHGGPMALWDALFLVVPLVSTTFASFPRLFRKVGREDLAWVLIDEAGQAAPQACVGALWRAKRAVIVGDPIQLEPVVGVPEELVEPLRNRCGTPDHYVPPKASVQTVADVSNRFGTYLKSMESDKPLWLGSPLVVHRRCLDPMFSIANAIAYDGKMVHGSGTEPSGDKTQCSQWIHVPAEGAEEHWIAAQGRRALEQVRALVGNKPEDDEGQPKVYVISPFKSVAKQMRALLRREMGWNWETVERLCGTVHTFQGKEARDVIFLLGGNRQKPRVIASFAGKKPNLVNVAATRAKKRLYVIGDRDFWTGRHDTKGYYRTMAEMLDAHVAAAPAPIAASAREHAAQRAAYRSK